jgi:hypothetical protein
MQTAPNSTLSLVHADQTNDNAGQYQKSVDIRKENDPSFLSMPF